MEENQNRDPFAQEEQVNHTRTFDPLPQASPFTTYQYDKERQRAAVKQEKAKAKYVTRGAFILTLICCMILTSLLTIGGIVLIGKVNALPGVRTGSVSATNYNLADATGSEKSVQEITMINQNAVVEIRTESAMTDTWLRGYVQQGAGSGVIIDSNGYIMTCNHVIAGANTISVTTHDKKTYEAKVIGADELTDIAILKIDGSGFDAAIYGNSDQIAVGDMTVAIGNPLGELGGSVSAGIVSALDRQIEIDGKNMHLIQTDTAVNPGNSGGGLFDGSGNLIGIVVAKSGGKNVEGIGFAIPINDAAAIAKDLIRNGKVTGRALIGVNIIDLSSAEDAVNYGVRSTGVYVAEVTGENAKKAGFHAGDRIYYFGKQEIKSAADIRDALAKHKPGDKVKVTVVRDDKTVDLEVELSEQ